MDFTIQEDDIVARLAPLAVNGVQVIPMPESVAAFQRDFEEARITVAFNDLTSPDTLSTSKIVQLGMLSFMVVIQANKLRGETGVYKLYDRTSKLMAGFQPTNCEQLKSKSFHLISDEGDLFTFAAMFECEAMNVEDWIDPSDTAPVITRITINDPNAIVLNNSSGFGDGFSDGY